MKSLIRTVFAEAALEFTVGRWKNTERVQGFSVLLMLVAGAASMRAQEPTCAARWDTWEMHNTIDPINNEGKFDLCIKTKADGTFFAVDATCSSGSLTLKITTEENLRFRSAVARSSIDGRPFQMFGTLEFTNQAMFTFPSKAAMASNGLRLFGSADDIFAARVMKIEVPLADGRLPVLKISLEQPEFKKFASACNFNPNQKSAINADEFRTAFANALQQRAPLFGVDASLYGAVVKEISDLVQLCSTITPQQYASAFVQGPRGPALYASLARLENGKYKQCQSATFTGVTASPVGSRGVVSMTSLRNYWNYAQHTWIGPKFSIEILFTLTRVQADGKWTPIGDPPISIMDGSYERKYVILSVDVK